MPLVALHPAGTRGVDYSYGRPNYAELRRLGYRFAVRYLHPNRRHAKVLSPGERDDLHEHGIGILLVWEINEARPLSGAAAGAYDGREACEFAYELGFPPELPILCAFDTNIDPKRDPAAATQAFAYGLEFAKNASPYGFGPYGDTDVIEMFRHVSVLNWLPNASSWSSLASPAQAIVDVRQGRQQTIAGAVCDPNTVVRPIRSWLPTPDPAPAPPPPITITIPAASTAAALFGGPDMWFICARTEDGKTPAGLERWVSNGIVRLQGGTAEQLDRMIVDRVVVGTLEKPARLYPAEQLPPFR